MAACIYSINPLMTEERRKFLLLPDYVTSLDHTSSVFHHLGKQHADSDSGGSSGGSMSVSSASSGGGSQFFRGVSPKELSDVSDGDMALGVGETNKAGGDDDEPDPKYRRVRIYVEEGSELVEKGCIGMYECRGCYTFARELRSELELEPVDASAVVLAHVVAPWAPQYPWAEYYAADNEGGRVSLNPLELPWVEFSKQIDYVIMKKSVEVNGVTFALIRDNGCLWELNIPAFLLGSREYFLKIAHMFVVAREGMDPTVFEKGSLEQWLTVVGAAVRYLDDSGMELDYYIYPGEDENAESGESFVAGDAEDVEQLQRLFSISEDSSGEIVDDMEIEGAEDADQLEDAEDADQLDNAQEVEADGVGVGNEEVESDGVGVADEEVESDGVAEEDVEAGGVAEEDGWNELMVRLARVEFTLS